MPIVNRVADLHPEITAWRRDIHAHPELLYDVHRTAASVAEKLKSFGCDEVATGIGRTGVVGVIRGRKAGGKVVGLRADMDALPIEEATNLPYKSTVPGKMHACGHDGHTAMLLGAAKYLADTRNFAGTAVRDLPAGGGGRRRRARHAAGRSARSVRHRGSLRHAQLPRACRSGNLPSAPDRQWRRPTLIVIKLEGVGAHAGFPHRGVDTILVGAQIVNQLQSIVVAKRRSAGSGGRFDLYVSRRRDRKRHSAARPTARHRAQPFSGSARALAKARAGGGGRYRAASMAPKPI